MRTKHKGSSLHLTARRGHRPLPFIRVVFVSLPSLQISEDSTKGSKATLVYGQMNEPPGARARVALTGLTIAEVRPSFVLLRALSPKVPSEFFVVCLPVHSNV